MNSDDLLKQQEELQKAGKQLLEKIGLIEFISKLGKPEIVGSMASGLMIRPDVDIEVIADEINDEDYWETVRFLFYIKNFYHSLYIQDFRKSQNPNTPKGLYIGTRVNSDGKEWKIDLWFISPRKPGEQNYNEWIKGKINNSNRKIILEIKSEIYKNLKYTKEIFSIDIYKAVIEDRVKNLEDFAKYLSQTNRSL
ncbi:MAG: hypothetical protein AAB520_00485 [Patescibacteria group bacterium]